MAKTYNEASTTYDSINYYNGVKVRMLRPISDQSVGLWTPTPLWSRLDEREADESDYVQSQPNPVNDTAEVMLASVTDPAISTGHTVRFRYRKEQAAASQIDLTVQLVQGNTVIASTLITNVSENWTNGSYTLTESEVNSITNYGDLRLRFVGMWSGQFSSNQAGTAQITIQAVQTILGTSDISDIHPEAALWVAAVGSGNVDATARNALSAFFTAIDPAPYNGALRQKIHRLNLFCGNSLTQALQPQIRSTTHNNYSTIQGRANDTLRDDGSANSQWTYSQAAGLTSRNDATPANNFDGAATSRPFSMIGTGIQTSLVGQTGCFGFYCRNATFGVDAGGTKAFMGTSENAANDWVRLGWSDTDNAMNFCWLTPSSIGTMHVANYASIPGQGGFWLGSREDSNNIKLWQNGTLRHHRVRNTETAPVTAWTNEEIPVFTAWSNTNWTGYYIPGLNSGGYIIAKGITNTEAATLSTAFEAFNDALGRGIA